MTHPAVAAAGGAPAARGHLGHELSFSMIMDWRRLVRHLTPRGHHA